MTNTRTPDTNTRYRVICQDGRTRHTEPFATREDAETFANWGHCCTVGHVVTTEDQDDTARCVACGDPADYCHGHGPSGDPYGWEILSAHDDDRHDRCHPFACEDAATV